MVMGQLARPADNIVLGIAIYKSLTMANNRNYEQITRPYFEKYKVK